MAGAGMELGPTGLLVRAVERSDVGWWVGLCLVALAFIAGAGWLVAAARPRRQRTASDRSRPVGIPAPPAAALFVVTMLRIARHRQLRLNAVAAVVVPFALGLAAAAALDLRGPPIVAFAGGLALTAAAVYPAAAQGLAEDARWLLRAAPARAAGVAAAVSSAGALAAVGIVTAAVCAAAPVGRAGPATYGQLEAATAFLLGCAAFAGAVVPWRPDAVVQQIASYGALIVTTVVVWALAGRLEPVGAALGLTEAAFGLLVGNAVLIAGVAGSAVLAR
jgi:multisubunit Na+/H+ antiporter MnhB subunit